MFFLSRNAPRQENLQATCLHMNIYIKKGDAGEFSPSEHKGFCSTFSEL